jgi:hypothetical protein
MLWYKFWLETRWRLGFSVGMYVLQIIAVYQSRLSQSKPMDAAGAMGALNYVCWLTAIFAAANGIKTQSASISSMKGLHGSTYFTLTLPISRFQLFSSRALYGIVQMLLVLTGACVATWALFPPLRDSSTLAEALLCGLTFTVCSLGFYFLSALLSIFLDAQWQVYGSLIAIFGLWWAVRGYQSDLNVFRVFRDSAPLVTHTIPWMAMLVSVWIGLILFVAAAREIERREF